MPLQADFVAVGLLVLIVGAAAGAFVYLQSQSTARQAAQADADFAASAVEYGSNFRPPDCSSMPGIGNCVTRVTLKPQARLGGRECVRYLVKVL